MAIQPPLNGSYVGRFAPSPSGPLHLGSLVCALASYFDAKQNRGRWLVRMEDIDPPREHPNAKTLILESLKAHGLHWDDDVLFQSTRSNAYTATLKTLLEDGLAYRCSCTRKRVQALVDGYDGHCLKHPPASKLPAALRLQVSNKSIEFKDRVLGAQQEDLNQNGDFIIHRKDGLFAYQLAVVVDDIFQGITHVVRGVDLLDSTAKQIHLFQLLSCPAPVYAHIPVVKDERGDKLSKQTFAPAIDNQASKHNLIEALRFLRCNPPPELVNQSIEKILQYGMERFSLGSLQR